MSVRPYSPEELESLARLEAMADDDIDTSDIPEITEEQWSDSRRPRYMRERQQPVSLSVDGGLVRWLNDHAEGRPIEAEINLVLREYVDAQERRAG